METVHLQILRNNINSMIAETISRIDRIIGIIQINSLITMVIGMTLDMVKIIEIINRSIGTLMKINFNTLVINKMSWVFKGSKLDFKIKLE